MQMMVDQASLDRAFTQASRIIPPQNTRSALEGLHLSAVDDTVTVTATDLITWFQITIPATVSEPGVTIVPAPVVTPLIHRVPAAMITLQAASPSDPVSVRYGRNRATLQSLDPAAWPTGPALDPPIADFPIEEGFFTRHVPQLIFACDKGDAQPILQGVLFALRPDSITLVATDGMRLSRIDRPWPAAPQTTYTGVLPVKFLREAAHLNSTQSVRVQLFAHHITLSTPEAQLTTQLLHGSYPDYERVIPREFVLSGTIAATAFRGAIDRASLIAAKNRSLSLRIRHDAEHLVFTAEAAEYGTIIESVAWEGENAPLSLLCNPQFLLDAIKSLGGEHIAIAFSGPQSPLMLHDPDDPTYHHVLLPLRELV